MIYVLQNKYYEEGYYEIRKNVCAFTSASVAKEVEYILASYLDLYKDGVETPNGYFNVLKANREDIIEQFTKVFKGDSKKAKALFEKLNVNTHIREWHRDWKNDGPWFKTSELSEF